MKVPAAITALLPSTARAPGTGPPGPASPGLRRTAPGSRARPVDGPVPAPFPAGAGGGGPGGTAETGAVAAGGG